MFFCIYLFNIYLILFLLLFLFVFFVFSFCLFVLFCLFCFVFFFFVEGGVLRCLQCIDNLYQIPGAPKNHGKTRVFTQKTWFLGSKNKVFDG